MINGIKRALKKHLALSMAWNGEVMYYYLKGKTMLDAKDVLTSQPINIYNKAENQLIELIAKDVAKEIKVERKKRNEYVESKKEI